MQINATRSTLTTDENSLVYLLWITLCVNSAQWHCTALHAKALHYTKLNYTTLHYTTLHYTTPHHTTPHYTKQHYTTLLYTTRHYSTLSILHYKAIATCTIEVLQVDINQKT